MSIEQTNIIPANNIIKKVKYSYVGINSMLIDGLIRSDQSITLYDSVTNIRKEFTTKELQKHSFESEQLRNKHVNHKPYVLKFYRWN